MPEELPEQSYGNDDAGQIGDQPAWVTDDLEYGIIGCVVHLILIKSLSVVAKGCVHVDESPAGLIVVHVEDDVALEVERNFRALVEFILDSKQLDGVGQVFPLGPKRGSPESALVPDRLESEVGQLLALFPPVVTRRMG